MYNKRLLLFFNDPINTSLIQQAIREKAPNVIQVRGLSSEDTFKQLGSNLTVTSLASNATLAWCTSEEVCEFDQNALVGVHFMPIPRVVKVSTFNCPPSVLTDENNQPYDGLEYNIIQSFATWAKMQIKFEALTSGTQLELRDKIRNEVLIKKSEIGMCFQWQNVLNDLKIKTSHPYGRDYVTLLVPKPKIIDRIYVFKPLHYRVWVYTELSIIFLTVLVRIVVKVYVSVGVQKYRDFNISATFKEVVKITILGYSSVLSNLTKPYHIKFIFLLLSVQALFVINSYSAGYSSMLIHPCYAVYIDDFNDMESRGVTWEQFGNTFFIDQNDPLVQRVMKLRAKDSHGEINQRLRLYRRGLNAIVTDYKYVINSNFIEDDVKGKLQIIKDGIIHSMNVVFVFQENSNLTEVFNGHLFRLIEHGFVDHWRKEITMGFKPDLFKHKPITIMEPQALTMINMQGALYSLSMGNALAGVAFVVENVWGGVCFRNHLEK